MLRVSTLEDIHPTRRIFTMVVIRLSRGGAKARPFYTIVVADKRVLSLIHI